MSLPNEFLEIKLSAVKKLLLERLLNEGNDFPKGWVKSSELLALSNQKYFDRRLRELRDEYALSIETSIIDGETCWRISSLSFQVQNKRTYLSATDKKRLFQEAGQRCVICGEEKGLQADHRVPVSRNGSSEYDNWQVLCVDCNNAKRASCKNCTYDCNDCGWAYPNIENRILRQFPDQLQQKLYETDIKEDDQLISLIIEALKDK